MDSNGKQYSYTKNQLVEVICQLRFPAILSIDTREPADFQELVREKFPRYTVQIEKKQTPAGEQSGKNHAFISGDGKYKISLTKNFIAVSTMGYSSWADFAGWMDEPLGHFISVYKPAFFERIGLRYVNGFSRLQLGLEELQWRELIAPAYLGVLAQADTEEKRVSKCSTDVEMLLDEKCGVRLHAGPGHIKRSVRSGGKLQELQEKEPRFIFDQDVFTGGSIRIQDAAQVLETLHGHADRVFAGAISDRLHEAMEPVCLI